MVGRFLQCWARLAIILLTFLAAGPVSAAPWLPFGPDGGDARRIAPDPHDHTHLFLGTANGWLYESHNAGANWRRLARVAKRDDLVLDSIVVDPADARHLIVGAWTIAGTDGGVYITYDAGANWINQAEMRGQSVRALSASVSDPRTLVAGTLKGVYRSTDGGQRWKLISPADSTEIHEVESIAIDPKDPNVIYAGTWHLPWKTTDGGEHWDNIKQGIIDDSDVFSIIIDPIAPAIVYASACSGIYKSEDAGTQFRKVQGIPSTARRTRVLLQDPNRFETVFAGTTEGLWRSTDAGRTWARTTGPEVIVNDVSVDKSNSQHILIATDRGGVLISEDGGDTFISANAGFSARQITAFKGDVRKPATVYVGVVNDKEWGGVFESGNGGLAWIQRSAGLGNRDVFALGQAPDGTLIAGTSHGIFRLDEEAEVWNRVEDAPVSVEAEVNPALPPTTRPPVPVRRNEFIRRTAGSRARTHTVAPVHPKSKLKGKPTGLSGKAARSKSKAPSTKREGRHVLPSSKRNSLGKSRSTGATPRKPTALMTSRLSPELPVVVPVRTPASPTFFDGSVLSLATSGKTILAATSVGLLTSMDNGLTFQPNGTPGSAEWRVLAAFGSDVVAASLRAVFRSFDSGTTWVPIPLPEALTQVSAVTVDGSGAVWVGGREGVFVSSDAGITWTTPKNLFINSVRGLFYDAAKDRVLVAAANLAFTVQLPARSVTFADTGWNVRFVRPIGDHLLAATLFDGIVIQPRMVATPVPPAAAGAR